MQRAREAKRLPILDELDYRIDKQIAHIQTDLHSGDEVTILAFLRQHVEPLFEHIAGFGPAVRERVEAYRAALDPQVGTIYRKRKDYEESVTAINEARLGLPGRRAGDGSGHVPALLREAAHGRRGL